jgi:hypothetical protein
MDHSFHSTHSTDGEPQQSPKFFEDAPIATRKSN